jgi:hypothetical protein
MKLNHRSIRVDVILCVASVTVEGDGRVLDTTQSPTSRFVVTVRSFFRHPTAYTAIRRRQHDKAA